MGLATGFETGMGLVTGFETGMGLVTGFETGMRLVTGFETGMGLVTGFETGMGLTLVFGGDSIIVCAVLLIEQSLELIKNNNQIINSYNYTNVCV